jgi:cbb3-type cytochrome oxidase subunit 3
MAPLGLVRLLIVLFLVVVFIGFLLLIPLFAYTHGKKVGDQAGYIRGFMEGRQGR